MPRRRIFKGTGRSEREVEVLLQNLLVAESLVPPARMWLVSPWITDIEVVDNRAAGFAGIEPLWPQRRLRLTEVLASLAQRGTEIVIATRSDEHNLPFHRRMEVAAAAVGASNRVKLVIDEHDEQHEKGLLSDGFFLSGSMNFTVRGIRINDEAISITLDPDEIAQARINMRDRYGSTNR